MSETLGLHKAEERLWETQGEGGCLPAGTRPHHFQPAHTPSGPPASRTMRKSIFHYLTTSICIILLWQPGLINARSLLYEFFNDFVSNTNKPL